ncbi:MAG: sigma 54 modulation protein/ribosomal protein [Gammaproteobacteria bacterium]|jgi:putative sigma-54 modulation protein|nr:sigma 54 modulation protein/ribosomal protein [Gammaproteobacteria bacterium]
MLDLQITARHVEITDAIRNHVYDKFKKLERYLEYISHPMMILSIEKGVQTAEAKLHIMGHEIFAESQTHDLYQAIDEVVDKLDKQIGKLKDKLQDHHKTSHKNNLTDEE